MPKFLWKIVSFSTNVCFFTIIPLLLKYIWPSIKHSSDNESFIYLLFLLSSNVAVIGATFLFFELLYSKKITMFEKYRIQNREWPSQRPKEADEWKKIFKKTFINNFLNTI